jgi:hypothetical protein
VDFQDGNQQRLFNMLRLVQQESGTVLVNGLALFFPTRKEQISFFYRLLKDHIALLKATSSFTQVPSGYQLT